MVFTFILFIFSSISLEENEVDIPKAVLIFLPIVFSQAGRSAEVLNLLSAGSFNFDPHLQRRFPQENWDQLFSASYEACKLAMLVAAEGDNIAKATGDMLEGASDNATERDNLAIATEGDMPESTIVTGTEGDSLSIAMDASDNAATKRDNLAIATEGATGSDNVIEMDNLAITAEGDKPTIPESDAEIGKSSSGLEWLVQVVRIILELILGTFSIHL